MEGKVLTPWGFELVGDIAPGDQVCNPDGTVARVIACHDRGPQQFYRVTLADGSSVETSGDHLWAVSIAGVRKRRKTDVPVVAGSLRPEDEWNLRVQQRTSIVTTERLAGLVERAEQDKAGGKRARYVQIPLTAPVALSAPKGRWQTLPPYTLGVLIGDGTIGGRDVRFTTADEEVVERVNSELPGGISARVRERHANCNSYAVTGAAGIKTDSVQKLLDRDGLSGKRSWEKFVPERVKLGTVETRTAFVQGLFDADGHMDERGHVEFVTVSERLARDVQWLVRSLGCTATLGTKQPHYTHKGERRAGRMAYRLYVRGAALGMLFGMSRKSGRSKPFNGGDVWPSHRIVSVEKTEVDNARCITVDNPNGLYVTDDFIVTHNSEALLMAALMFVTIPGYAAILFRKTYSDLALEGALMDRAQDWLSATDAQWRDKHKRWEFPYGGTMTFGYLDGPRDWRRYDSSEFQSINFDEATQFRPHDLNALMQRLRRKMGVEIPIRMRYASNPGGEAHDFFGDRFVVAEKPHPDRAFVPALLEDNPYVDREDYETSLEALADYDELLYRQRRFGVWVKDTEESIFKEEWFDDNRYHHSDGGNWQRSVARFAALDTANTDSATAAYSALGIGELMPEYTMPLRHAARGRMEFPDLVEWTIEELYPYSIDGKLTAVFIEDAASGRQLIQTLRTSGPRWLQPLIVAVKPNGQKNGKEVSWKAASVWAKRRMMPLPHPEPSVGWLHDYEKELFSVPNTEYKDQADMTAILINEVERLYRPFSKRWKALMGSRVAAEESAGEVV